MSRRGRSSPQSSLSFLLALASNLEMSLSSRSQTEPQWSTGVKAPEFPFSAATNPRQAAHSSGLDLRIHLEPPVSGRDVYCTSETLRGTILVTRQMGANSTSPFAERDVLAWIRSLSVRFQCESRSMFWTILDDKEAERRKLEMQENVPPSSLSVVDLGEAVHRTLSRGSRAAGAEKKKKKSHKESVRWSLEPEWARATFGEVSLVANGAVQVAGAEERWDALALPFQVALPTEIAFDEWSHFPEADRSLHRDLRPAPPSARDPADASVEWIVEAVLDLRWASRSNLATPLHLTPTHSPTASIASVSTTSFDQDQLDPWRNSRGLLLSKPSRLVSRTVVSVVPADARSLGHDLSQECVPGFAEQERMALRSHAGRATSSSAEAHRHSSTWTRVIELRTNALGTIMGHLTAEVSCSCASLTLRLSPDSPLAYARPAARHPQTALPPAQQSSRITVHVPRLESQRSTSLCPPHARSSRRRGHQDRVGDVGGR